MPRRRFPTPEQAALGLYPEGFARVIGAVERGDEAVVSLLVTEDGGGYDTETDSYGKTSEGWEPWASYGNGGHAHILTGEGLCTVVQVYGAPRNAVAGRFRLGEFEKTVAVEDGFAFVVFDDVPFDDRPLTSMFDRFERHEWSSLESWIYSHRDSLEASAR